MSNLQKTLDALQPYVIGIRYLDGMPVIDAVFKDGWTVPDSNIITKVKGNNDVNYYMLYSENDGIGLDELLEYVDATIKANIEREKKHELLKEKINDLKEIFKKNTLLKLKNLKFIFSEEDFVPELNDLDLEQPEEEPIVAPESVSVIEQQDSYEPPTIEENLTDEEREILEEEARAENFRKTQEIKKNKSQLDAIKNKIELPPKKVFESGNQEYMGECECGPDEACGICIDKKDF
jgi:hypothetical protein